MSWQTKLAMTVLLFATAPQFSLGQTPSTPPVVIPALREWSGAPGTYRLASQSRILVSDDSLLPTGNTLAQDLFDLTGKIFPVAVDTNPNRGDIFLKTAVPQLTPSEEGYSIAISSSVMITSSTDAGVFYGTRTLLQLLKHSLLVPAGSGRDWPSYPERGLMLDVGNKFFSMAFLRRHIRDMAYLKMNYLHLHLTQDDGFRLESSSHPEVVSPNHYTKVEIQELIRLATQYHILMVPEIDVPSHATAMLRNHPELQLPGHPEMLDLSKPGSYTLVQDLLTEFLPLFPGPYWHTGADEYLLNQDYALYPQYTAFAQQLYGPGADGQDLYVGFINQIDAIVKQNGKRLRAWNDLHGVTTVINTPNKDIILELYSANIGAGNALNQGFEVVNCSPTPLYYVLGVPSLRADPANLYENWSPNLQFVFDESVPPQTPGLLGGKLHVWADFPDAQTADQVQQGIFAPLRSFAQSSWGSEKLFPTYRTFSSAITEIGRVPGWNPDFGVIIPDLPLALDESQSGTVHPILKANSSFGGTITGWCTSNDPLLTCELDPKQVLLQPTEEQHLSVNVSSSAKSGAAAPGMVLFFSIFLVAVALPVSRKRFRPGLGFLLVLMFLTTSCGSAPATVTLVFASTTTRHSVTINIEKRQ